MKRANLCLITTLIACFHLIAQPITEIAIVPDETLTLEKSDSLPEYKGGQNALLKVLSDNLIYPTECVEANIQGSVLVQFVVSSKGKVKDITVLRSVHPLLDAEAIRVVGLLCDWKPGIKDGKKVNTYYNLPIFFKLQDETMPDFSKWTYFELRDGLINFFQDLYKDVPNPEYEMIKAEVINEFTGVKCVVHFTELPNYFRIPTETDMDVIMSQQLAPMLPYEFRNELRSHNITLNFEIHEDSTNNVYNIKIDNNLWIPENASK